MHRLVVEPRFKGALLPGGRVRLRGHGLGNLLLSWARAHVIADRLGAVVARPVWPQLRPRDLLWRDGPPRVYTRTIGPIAGELSRRERSRWVRAAVPVVLDQDRYLGDELLDDARSALAEGRAVHLYVPFALPDPFAPLLGKRELVRDLVWAAARPRQRPPSSLGDFAAVHVRLGDFVPAGAVGASDEGYNVRIPVEDYLEVLRPIAADHDRVLVFTDGTRREVAPLLALDNAVFVPRRWDPLRVILTMAAARTLVPSNSTFSAWSVLLGTGDVALAAPPGPVLTTALRTRDLA